MEVIGFFFLFLLIATFFASIIKNIYDISEALINYFYRGQINKYLLFRELNPEYLSILKRSSRYYNELNASDKHLFEKRVQKFITMKKFEARGGLQKVTSEMKVLIAASAIQVTFGYPGVYFKHFWRILLFPDNYYSGITNKYHRGEVNLRGLIVLSWNHFLSGYLDPVDGRNLGLHEMAHALRLENAIRNAEYDYIDEDVLSAFDTEIKAEKQKIDSGSSSFFRKYAAVNEHEFFAVAVENFFERPEELNNHNAYLYKIMTELLRQDPLHLGKSQLSA